MHRPAPRVLIATIVFLGWSRASRYGPRPGAVPFAAAAFGTGDRGSANAGRRFARHRRRCRERDHHPPSVMGPTIWMEISSTSRYPV